MAKQVKLQDYSNWMSNLPEKVQNLPINGIAIPGGHDSGTSSLDRHSGIAPGESELLKDFIKLFGEKGKDIVYDWSVTQDMDFTAQLTAGIRYFDLRTAYRSSDRQFLFVHGLYAGSVFKAMKDINAFLSEHKHEIVLLDFNHMYTMTPKLHSGFIACLVSIFGSKLCPLTDMQSLTLSYMWSHGYQVIVFYPEKNRNFWPSNKIVSPWANTTSVTTLIAFLEKNYHHGRSDDVFYVAQGVVTPTVEYILLHLFGTLKLTMAIPCDKILVPWLRRTVAGTTKMNIFICDFVGHCNYIKSVVALNYK